MNRTVNASVPRLLREWRSNDNGAMWLRFKLEGESDAATDAVSSALDRAASEVATDAHGQPLIGMSDPAVTPDGPVVFMDFCDSFEALEQTISHVAAFLAEEGWAGDIHPVTPAATPYDNPEEKAECVTAGLVLQVDQDAIDTALRTYHTAPGWYVDEDTTRAAVRLAATFCLEEPGDVYLRHDMSQFRVSPQHADRLMTDAIMRSPVAGLSRIGQDGSVHRAVLLRRGHVLYELRPADTDWVAAADTLRTVLRDHAAMADYGLVRLSLTHASGWESAVDLTPPKLPRVGRSYTQKWRHLENSRVPDAYGIQLLSDAHLQRAENLTAWRIEEVAPARHLVTAPDLDAWYCDQGPNDATLERARHDFDGMILDKASLHRP